MKKSRRKAALASICLIFILAFSSMHSLAAPLPPGRHVDPFDPGWMQRQRGIDLQGFARRAPRPPAAPEAPEWDVSPWSKIAFESFRDSTSVIDVRDEIYLVDGYGLNPTRLTTDTLTDYFPRLNRGCTQIAFTSIRDGMDAEIYLMNANGSGIIQRTANSDWDSNAVWSPDGSQIAFMSNRDGGDFDIFVMNSDGSSPTNLTNNDTIEDGQPFWSPDGSQIAFASDRNGGIPYIFVMDANGANPVQVSTQPFSENPAWSPDGSRIAYDADGDGDYWQEIWVMDADGGNAEQLVDFLYDDEFYDWGFEGYVRSWSPDGRFIGFSVVYWEWVPSEQAYFWYEANIYGLDMVPPTPLAYSLGGVDVDWDPDWQTCDALPPSSAVSPLPAESGMDFLVSWSGTDQTGAGQGLAGIKNYDIQVREGLGEAWEDWLVGTTSTSQTYNGRAGHTYYFRSRARDNAFNLEAYPAEHDAYTSVPGGELFLPHVAR